MGLVWHGRVPYSPPKPGGIAPGGADVCFDSNLLVPAQFSDLNRAPGQRARVFSTPVADGFYWWILLATIINTDPNGQSHDLFLVEPAFATQPKDSFFPTLATPNGFHKISPETGLANSGMIGQAGRGAAPFHVFPVIVVPSRWAIAAAEMNTVISGGVRDLHLRLIRAEVRNGTPPPF